MSETDATGTRRRLQALVAIGWPQAELARRLGLRRRRFEALMRRDRIPAQTAADVEGLYDRIWHQWPRGRHADGARAHAAALGWPVPAAWDDDPGPHCIDDPAAAPPDGWQPNPRAKRRAADLAEDADFIIITQGVSREQAARRIGVTKQALEKAYMRRPGSEPALATAFPHVHDIELLTAGRGPVCEQELTAGAEAS
jgi:hypothetical protein